MGEFNYKIFIEIYMCAAQVAKKKVKVKRYTYRGLEEEEVMDLKTDKIIELFRARIRRKFRR